MWDKDFIFGSYLVGDEEFLAIQALEGNYLTIIERATTCGDAKIAKQAKKALSKLYKMKSWDEWTTWGLNEYKPDQKKVIEARKAKLKQKRQRLAQDLEIAEKYEKDLVSA